MKVSRGFPDFDQFVLGFLAQLLVERPQRFIEQQQFGALRQSAGKRNALALAARKLMGLAAAEVLQPREFQKLGHAVGDLVPGQSLALEAIGDVVFHRHVREGA